jgi:glutaredoxin
LLAKRGVPYREVAVGDDKSREELKRVSGGQMVPVMAVGGAITKGFEPDMWHNALDAAGYPRSSVPQTAQAQKPAVPTPNVETPKPAEEANPQPRGPYSPR